MDKKEVKKENVKTEEKNNNQQLYNGIWKIEFKNQENSKIKVKKIF